MRPSRAEAALRWVARVLGTIVVVALGALLVGEAILEPIDPSTLAWTDAAALGLFILGIAGLALAWWRPLEGGLLAIVGVAIPIAQTLRLGNFPWAYLVIAGIGALHVVDALLRRRGLGPSIRPWGRMPARGP